MAHVTGIFARDAMSVASTTDASDTDDSASVASSVESFTCHTAPGVVFTSRADLGEHYRSDWHRYNLKRKVAGLPPLPSNYETHVCAFVLASRDAIRRHPRAVYERLLTWHREAAASVGVRRGATEQELAPWIMEHLWAHMLFPTQA